MVSDICNELYVQQATRDKQTVQLCMLETKEIPCQTLHLLPAATQNRHRFF
jgi:hypothetical protein